MTKVTEHIAQASSTLFSFEILPPLKGEGIQNLFDAISPLMEFKPAFIDVTYHRQEYVYKQRENGLLEKQSIRKRPGTVGICAAIMNRFHTDAVPHLICGGFDKEETENALIDLNFLGIDNVLALRGDAIKSEGDFVPALGGHHYASELVGQIANMNQGRYLDDEIKDLAPTNLCIGVAGYPEKHFESPNLNCDLEHLKNKIHLGGEYIVTQMFFDNSYFFEYDKKCKEMGINVPNIPGIKPITTKRQLTLLPRIFNIDIPEDLAKAVIACKDDKQVRQVGIEWCVEQSKELIRFGVPCLHYYSMSKSGAIRQIASELF